MITIDLCGGPGSGKTTLAHYLTYRLKAAGIRAEFVGEAARELIYGNTAGQTAPPLLDNQMLVTGMQLERIQRLNRHGVAVAINDSPLMQSELYAGTDYEARGIARLVWTYLDHDNTYEVFVHRTKGVYDPESRAQKTEADAAAYDKRIRTLYDNKFWREIHWGSEDNLFNDIKALIS